MFGFKTSFKGLTLAALVGAMSLGSAAFAGGPRGNDNARNRYDFRQNDASRVIVTAGHRDRDHHDRGRRDRGAHGRHDRGRDSHCRPAPRPAPRPVCRPAPRDTGITIRIGGNGGSLVISSGSTRSRTYCD
ncbi:MAG: hypothetical protein AB7Q00_07735 [Phycisphaerales bacterium]|nr:MAG: hypothetical protein IPK69_12405 [Phycisphaerales bacterium]